MLASCIAYKNKITAKLTVMLRDYYQKVTSLPDSTNKIIRGIALGFAFDFLPIPIVSIPISYLVARLLRCNPLAAACTVVFFKIAVPIFYILNVLTGSVLFGNISGPKVDITGGTFFADALIKITEKGYPFLLGSLVNAAVAYFVAYWLLKKRFSVNKSKGV